MSTPVPAEPLQEPESRIQMLLGPDWTSTPQEPAARAKVVTAAAHRRYKSTQARLQKVSSVCKVVTESVPEGDRERMRLESSALAEMSRQVGVAHNNVFMAGLALHDLCERVAQACRRAEGRLLYSYKRARMTPSN